MSAQGYKKHLENIAKPYKYANLLAKMRTIVDEDRFNSTYGKQRMYEKLQLDYECPHCYNTVAKVTAQNGLKKPHNKPKGLTRADKTA